MTSSLSAFMNLPPPFKIAFVVLGGGSLAGLITFLPKQIRVPILIGLACVALIVLVYHRLLKRLQKRKAAPFERGIADNAAATPQAVTEAARRAALEDLRKNFQKGIGAFRAAGKNLYGLPWYVIVGEPGSGKTEAIRHSSIGFPPGLHDPLQGAGGTINMNWWFTNHGVVLDTAGRLMFEEVQYGAPSEWGEFLRLLSSRRRNCPINGILLVIPADSLIMDTADHIQRKGQKIAQQLDHIQRTLGVRFPVYVVVTKCDLINGFREFFEDISDPELQHQMLGWSNPAPLDEQFKPELVDQNLRSLMERLERRRLGLLVDPVPVNESSARRTDEVDALYAFPRSLARVIPRLRRYLEMIFVTGEWSPKPLFLRGIYFTSSMREGSALDEELAEVLGVAAASLPEGRVWERERSYFLRDVFMNKVFREKGLVTRATHVNRQHYRRKAAVLTAGFGSAAIFALLTLVGALTFRGRIGQHSDHYIAASKIESDAEGFLVPVVKPKGGGSADYLYNANRVSVEDKKKWSRPAELHTKSLVLARKKITVPWVFSPWVSREASLDKELRAAQEKLYRVSVLKPVVVAARAKMRQTAKAAGWGESDYGTKALAQLIRLEAYAEELQTAAIAEEREKEFFRLDDLFEYVLDDQSRPKYQKDSEDLKECLARVYGPPGEAGWRPEGIPPDGAYAEDRPIFQGVKGFTDFWSFEKTTARYQGLQSFSDLFANAKTYRTAEKDFLDGKGDGKSLGEAKQKLDGAVVALVLLRQDPTTMKNGIEQAKKDAENTYGTLLRETETQEPQDAQQVVARVADELKQARLDLMAQLDQASKIVEGAGDYADLLAKVGERRLYEYRYDICMLNSAEKIAQEVKTRAADNLDKGGTFKRLEYPVIPLTNMQGGKYLDYGYHPDAADAFFSHWLSFDSAWNSAAWEHKGKLPQKLSAQYQDFRKALVVYLGEYVDYWRPTRMSDASKQPPQWKNDLRVAVENGTSWKSFRSEITNTTARKVLEEQEKLFSTIDGALEAVKKHVEHFARATSGPQRDEAAKRSREALDSVSSAIKRRTTDSPHENLRSNWSKLPEDAIAARAELLRRTGVVLESEYFPFERGQTPPSAGKLEVEYWADMPYAALELILADFRRWDAEATIKTLAGEEYSKFPLDWGATTHATPREVDAARQHVVKLAPIAEQSPKIGSKRVDDMLDSLRKPTRITQEDWDWVLKLKRVVDALPPDGQSWKCTVKLREPAAPPEGAGTNRFLNHYPNGVGFKQGAGPLQRGARGASAQFQLAYPDGDVAIYLYAWTPETPYLTWTINGAWAGLEILRAPFKSLKVSDEVIERGKDPSEPVLLAGAKGWSIQGWLPVPSRERPADWTVPVEIELDFPRAFPAIKDWPRGRPRGSGG